MIKNSTARKPERQPPSLFHAALTDDLDELRAALAAGERLNQRRPENGFSPLHTAALNGSANFIAEALKHDTADPWLIDKRRRRPIDHAAAAGHKAVIALLYDAMFGGSDDDFIIDEPDIPLT